jgi:hypothetical protein
MKKKKNKKKTTAQYQTQQARQRHFHQAAHTTRNISR